MERRRSSEDVSGAEGEVGATDLKRQERNAEQNQQLSCKPRRVFARLIDIQQNL